MILDVKYDLDNMLAISSKGYSFEKRVKLLFLKPIITSKSGGIL